jgi:hypothetical protein
VAVVKVEVVAAKREVTVVKAGVVLTNKEEEV